MCLILLLINEFFFYLLVILLATLEAAALSNGKFACNKTLSFPSYLVQIATNSET